MATIADVARVAGVSISTVSYALSGKRSVSAATRDRIDAAIAELGYRANVGARMLAGARSQIIALSAPIRPDGHMPTHMRFVSAIIERAREHGYDVLMLAADDVVDGVERVTASSLADAVIMIGVGSDDVRGPLVRRLGIPAAFIGIPDDSEGLSCIDLDFEEAGRAAVRTLVAGGACELGMIGHPESYAMRHTGFIARFDRGVLDECDRHGISLEMRSPQLGQAASRAALESILLASPTLDGLILHCNEPTVVEVLRTLAERGRTVPEDISVFAASASYPLAIQHPPLSGNELPIEMMCARAVDDVVRQIEGLPAGPVVLIAPESVDRGSIRA